MADVKFMKRALELATLGKKAAPNPKVGCVIAKNGKIVGEGYHQEYGGKHAEALALENAEEKAKGADMYVTLEPCCHLDKQTGPCVPGIAEAGVRKVFVAMADPNPKVNGKGVEALRNAGIEIETGMMGVEARRLNESYIKWITTGLPFVTLKLAMTLDGKIATSNRESRWISGEKSREAVREMRNGVQAIMIGVNTVVKDDPSLSADSRPVRVAVGNPERIPENAKMLDTSRQKTVIACAAVETEKKKKLERMGIEVLGIGGSGGMVDLRRLMKNLGENGIGSVLAEGGGEMAWSLLENGLADRIAFFVAPKIFGGGLSAVSGKGIENLGDAIRIKNLTVKRVGNDFLFEGYVETGTDKEINIRGRQ